MTDPTPAPQDPARAEVEALAAAFDRRAPCNCAGDPCRVQDERNGCHCFIVAAMLRALLARATAAEAERDEMRMAVATESKRLKAMTARAEGAESDRDVALQVSREMEAERDEMRAEWEAELANSQRLAGLAVAAEAQAAAAREGALREAEALVRDFSWVLPLYEDKAVNEATDDAAEEVARQIADAIAALAPTAPEEPDA